MASCDDLRLQLAATQTERDGAAATVISDRGDLAELEADASHVNPDLLAAARAKLAESEAQLRQLDEKLSSLRSALVASNCLVMQPAEILQLQFGNPTEVRNVDALFAQTVALGQPDPSDVLGGTFPSRDAQQEWKQVLPADLTNTAAHEADQEGNNLVGASGWALDPHYSGGDVPFTHPFAFDWEFMIALDRPAEEPDRYTFLLTPADQSCSEEGFPDAVAQAGDAQDGHGNPVIPRGPDGLPSLLGMEIDGGLVPTQFSDMARGGVEQGDRVAVFGRWIVDCGHQIPITECADPPRDVHPGETAFRTEIHPPLLMAAARVTSGRVAVPAALNAGQLTRVLVTSRPYLVSQRFTTDTGTVYDDLAGDDGPFFAHMVRETVKVNETILGIPTSSIQVEAHPKIKSQPFVGTHRMQLIVRPPAPNPLVGHGPLAVAFQFTVRRGCTVEVRPGDGDSINVVITLSSDDYRPPPLPARHERTWSKDELGALNRDSANAITLGEAISAAAHIFVSGGIIGAAEAIAVLERGIVTDEYDTDALTAANILDASQAIKAPASNIPNLDIQAQLAQLQQERSTTAVEVQTDEGDLAELQSESQHVNPAIIAKAVAKLNADRAKLKELDQQIAALQNTPVGVIQNDNQPFPVFGWVEVGYLARDAVAQP